MGAADIRGMAAVSVKRTAPFSAVLILTLMLGGCATSRPAVQYTTAPLPRSANEDSPRGWPLQGGVGQVSSPYGMRVHPKTGLPKMHEGIDIRAKLGTPVLATAGGSVTFVGTENGYGTTVKLLHGHGLETWYAHLARTAVTRGAKVRRGSVIGAVGASGNATGPHLHYEVRRAGKPLDPAPFISFRK
jgi:murein DD-endopeptidase MepM/ murein hydrolase activator NlpD